MSRERRRLLAGTSLVVILTALWTVGGVVSASIDDSPIPAAIEATERTVAAQSIVDQLVVVAGGGLLIGVGVGIAVASGVTYWYKSRQIAGRLR